jgi:hypothetical protein
MTYFLCIKIKRKNIIEKQKTKKDITYVRTYITYNKTEKTEKKNQSKPENPEEGPTHQKRRKGPRDFLKLEKNCRMLLGRPVSIR